jgi:hypothetical protein
MDWNDEKLICIRGNSRYLNTFESLIKSENVSLESRIQIPNVVKWQTFIVLDMLWDCYDELILQYEQQNKSMNSLCLQEKLLLSVEL